MERKNKWNRVWKPRRKGLLLGILGALILLGGVLVYAQTELGETKSSSVSGIEYYAALDDEWQRIDIGYTVPGRETLYNQYRYYTTPADLQEHYEKFGFTEDKYSKYAEEHNGTAPCWFPHTAAGDSNQLWGDAAPVKSTADGWKIPLAKDDKIYVYYLPKNGGNEYFAKDKTNRKGALELSSQNGQKTLQDNMFYSIALSDPDKKTGEEKAEVQYVEKGGSYTVTLPAADGYEWECVNRKTLESLNKTKVTQTKGEDPKTGKATVTFTITDIQEPIKIQPTDPKTTQLKIIYNAATVNDSLQEMGDSSASIQKAETNGTINNQDSFTFYVDSAAAADTSLKILSPDSDRALVAVPRSSQGKKFWYSFTGWRLNGTGKILTADSTMTVQELKRYEIDGEIELDAAWSGKNSGGRVNSANFYVNKTCEISDNMSDGANAVPKEGFTQSVYTAQVKDECNNMTLASDGSYLLLAPDSQYDNAYTVDASIRGMVKDSYTDQNGNTLGIKEFPSDEDVLANLRANYDTGNPIKVNNQVIPKEDLTTTNFKVRWYSTKYQKSDGWHVDGILVAKEGKVVIKKSFEGNASAAIQDLKNFNITVTHQNEPNANDSETEDYKLVLKAKNDQTLADGKSGTIKETGYDTYDEATHTYTWILTVRDYQQYAIEEHEYKTDRFDRSEHVYTIRNTDNNDSAKDEEKGSSWQTYTDDGVTITARSYASDVPTGSYQTVELRNLYVNSSFITLDKMDDFTVDGLQDVSFQVSRIDKQESKADSFQLYRVSNSNAYSDVQEKRGDYDFAEKVSGNTIQTNSTGLAYLKLSAGTYLFHEQTPEGYQTNASYFKIVVENNAAGTGTYIKSSTPCDAQGNPDSSVKDFVYSSKDSSVLTVKNKAEQLTTVTAKANMGDVTADSVKVELWCNGAKLSGSQYTQELNAKNNWTYTWKNLPLYADGAAAKYTLRETQIGDTAYDPGVNGDGYADYDITYDDCKYREGDSGEYDKETASWRDDADKIHYAKHALLTVHNARTVVPAQYVTTGVKVAWNDSNNQDGIRPANVNIKLLDADGNQAGTERSLNADGSWSAQFVQLNKFAADGKTEIQYQITEKKSFAEVKGYTSRITGDMKAGYTITFDHTPETVEIAGTKVWNDNNNAKNKRPDSITVNLLADGEKVGNKTVKADQNWNWSFGTQPKYKDGKEIVYTISEDQVEHYTSTVVKDQDQYRYTITNTYTPPEIKPETSSITDQLSVTKTLEGRTLQKGEFSFELLEGTDVVATGTNDADGNVTLSAITYNEAGSHTYTLREHKGDAGGITYDTKSYTIHAKVTEKDNGSLEVTYTADQRGALTFTNTYKAKAATASITAVKHLTGGTLKAGAFSFQLKDEHGKVINMAKNDSNGVIAFKDLKFDTEGSHRYTISEVNDKQKNITYDTSEKKVVVTVKDNGHGALEASVESDEELSFTNACTGGSGTNGAGGADGTGGTISGSGAKTGDSSDIALALGLMLIAATAVGILAVRRKIER